MAYLDTFIAVAEDSKAVEGKTPQPRGGRETIPQIEYRLLTASPYRLTQDQLTFETHLIRSGLLPDSVEKKEKASLWAALFAKGQPCMRASSLTKSHGWGAHFDSAGKIAIYGIDSVEYKKLSRQSDLTQLKAMRSSRK